MSEAVIIVATMVNTFFFLLPADVGISDGIRDACSVMRIPHAAELFPFYDSFSFYNNT